MTDIQQREAARQFYYKWKGRGREDEDARSYWIDILQNILGAENVTDRIDFEKKVIGPDGNTKRIDVYIPETRVLIEQKSLDIDLDKPQGGHGGMTPYEQAKMYDNGLPYGEKSRWIVTSNFAEIWIYDMEARKPEPLKLALDDLQAKYHLLDFLVNKKAKKLADEMQVSLRAGELVGILYDAFLKQYKNPDEPETLKSLNKLCVRLVFCLYAEDAGIFRKKNLFRDYMAQFDAKGARKALRDLFRVLDQKPEERDTYLADDDPLLAAFPYVNGGLFADEDIEIPPFTDELMTTLLQKASGNFDWSDISPTIFGAVFESTLNPETRRSGGMHYTSIENIHKVIDPLFLDELKKEYEEIAAVAVIRTKTQRLKAFQDKLAGLTFLDPACGSGNFLTETYLSLRRLENKVIADLIAAEKGTTEGQIMMGDRTIDPIKVSIGQFYGIEINDFAVTVAKTALWIAESQMLKETEDIVRYEIEFLPLKSYANIVEANALRIDWETVVPKSKLNYIMGNPPFRGHRLHSKEQAKDLDVVFGNLNKRGKLDYVSCWFEKAADFCQKTKVSISFVATNSICQGESVGVLWQHLVTEKNVEIQFAYRTFVWDSEASDKASVHCVIIGFCTMHSNSAKRIFNGTEVSEVQFINGYLDELPSFFLPSRSKQINKDLPRMIKGSEATDGTWLSLTKEEREEIINDYPYADKFIKRYVGSYEYINNKERYCIWLLGAAPNEYRNIPPIMERIKKVKEFRANNVTPAVRKLADTPAIFAQIRQPGGDYLLVPQASSQNRKYIPIGYVSKDVIANPKVLTIENASMLLFGVLESNVHMAWMRAFCGRLKSDYSYYPAIYNNFPWQNPSEEQKAMIEQTAQGILDARALYPDASLADLYDEVTMPPELRKAHQANDRAVMQAYGFDIKTTTEASCVAELMKLYQALVGEKKNA